MFARGAVRHAIDDLDVSLLGGREKEVGDGEAALVLTTRDRGTRADGEYSANEFSLRMSAYIIPSTT